MTKLHILITSTRPGRKGPAVAKWIDQFARSHGGFEVELVDVAAFDLPVFDEPEHPAKRDYEHDTTKSWSASVDAADAFVFVLPEYNHHAPSSLINAMEFLSQEWGYKPVAFVSYGGLSGGMRAVEVTKLFVTTFRMVPLLDGVIIPFFDRKLDEDGVFLADESLDQSAKKMLDELLRWTDAMRVLRPPKS